MRTATERRPKGIIGPNRQSGSSDVWANLVGTSGVGSAGYWWSRPFAAVVRIVHYLLDHRWALWALIYADDGMLVATGRDYQRRLWRALRVLMLLGVPLAWHKTTGGLRYGWIGYEIDLFRYELGISERKKEWVLRWISERLRDGMCTGSCMRGGLGRLNFVTGPLVHLRSLLGPLYAFVSVVHSRALAQIPLMAGLVTQAFAKSLGESRMTPCTVRHEAAGDVFRV